MTALGPSKHLRARKDARQSKRKTVHHMIKTESMARMNILYIYIYM